LNVERPASREATTKAAARGKKKTRQRCKRSGVW
jgi:hypothetical protein